MNVPKPTRCLNHHPLKQTHTHTQTRSASFLRRPHRPYTFTQLTTLSDGSTYTQRTTSPLPIYKSAKDSRNTLLWQPSLSSLRNVELDEAGKLRAFREKFGRGWDVDGTTAAEEEGGEEQEERALGDGQKGETSRGRKDGGGGGGQGDSFMDLISTSYDARMGPAASKRRDGK